MFKVGLGSACLFRVGPQFIYIWFVVPGFGLFRVGLGLVSCLFKVIGGLATLSFMHTWVWFRVGSGFL